MNILVVGSGGREHTLTWKIKQSPLCENVFVAPGNAGTAAIATNVAIGVNDFEALGQLCLDENIGLVLVGPEEPLVKGFTDYFQNDESLKDILVIGPDAEGAQLEGSKDYAKEFMFENDIPTAAYKTFTKETEDEALDYIDAQPTPIVLKADGLAAGKGVIITEDKEEAKQTIKSMFDGQFGDASSQVVIEAFLKGIELSVFLLCDGENFVQLPEAKDYKRIGEGDTGPNTGGMGALSPVPFANEAFMQKVRDRVVLPTIEGLKKRNIKYKGFIFLGLINVDGDPFVIEYNARMGDPETQVVIPRIKNDLVELLIAAGKGELGSKEIEISDENASTVVCVAGGYPGAYEKGKVINGLDSELMAIPFHAGTKLDNGIVVTNGGRVLAFTGLGKDLNEALSYSFDAAKKVTWEDYYYRSDIGFDILETVDR